MLEWVIIGTFWFILLVITCIYLVVSNSKNTKRLEAQIDITRFYEARSNNQKKAIEELNEINLELKKKSQETKSIEKKDNLNVLWDKYVVPTKAFECINTYKKLKNMFDNMISTLAEIKNVNYQEVEKYRNLKIHYYNMLKPKLQEYNKNVVSKAYNEIVSIDKGKLYKSIYDTISSNISSEDYSYLEQLLTRVESYIRITTETYTPYYFGFRVHFINGSIKEYVDLFNMETLKYIIDNVWVENNKEVTITNIKGIQEIKVSKEWIRRERGRVTPKIRLKVLERDNYTCRMCGNSIHKEPNLLLEVDHIIPVSKGGTSTLDNLQTLCWKCNRTKHNKII